MMLNKHLLAPGKAAHDSGPTEEPQEADKPNDGETGSREQKELEEPSRSCGCSLLKENTLV